MPAGGLVGPAHPGLCQPVSVTAARLLWDYKAEAHRCPVGQISGLSPPCGLSSPGLHQAVRGRLGVADSLLPIATTDPTVSVQCVEMGAQVMFTSGKEKRGWITIRLRGKLIKAPSCAPLYSVNFAPLLTQMKAVFQRLQSKPHYFIWTPLFIIVSVCCLPVYLLPS
ncbi:hypothetical protein UPYG_G00305130 [Umbra pygmaea]|uniref:Uncharacterized protein n=1 Tax=Umbra pygmaea TaxID=75934 RepID=A0ABD0W370_UMBPY